MNIYQVIRREVSPHLGSVALVEGERQISYGDLLQAVDEIAGVLRSRGVEATDRVALSCADSIEYIVASLAVLSLGSAMVPVSPSYSRDEVRAVLEDIDVSLLLSDKELLPLDPVQPTLSGEVLEKTLFVQPRAPSENLPKEYYALNPAFIRFSSGTTGASKGVVLSHETIVERTDAADRALEVSEKDRVIWVLSMSYHFVATILLFLRRAATIVLCGGNFPSSLVDGLVRHRGTFIYASPFHYQTIAGSNMFSEESLNGVRLAISTAMRLPDSDAQKFREKFGVELAEAYGVIEVGLPFVNRSSDPDKRGSVGCVLPDYEAKIENVDAEGVGEMYLRGKGMLDAYFSPWRSRDQILVDGWFKTGDLGRLDSDGFLFLAGRDNDVINFTGMKVFPEEVESVLNQHPAVGESLVYAKPHPQYGELPCADIVPSGGTQTSDLDATEMRRFCYRHLAPYKVPKEFRFVPDLDRTASGKLKRARAHRGAAGLDS
jgi:long-chain acyl-CoA synthetase